MFEKLSQTFNRSAAKADALPAQEKMQYPIFMRSHEAYRAALIPGQLIDFNTTQLPNMSTLHTINHFLDPHTTDDINPDLTNPLLVNEQWMIYLQHCLTIPTRTTLPFPVAEHYTYIPNRYKAQIMAFFHQQHWLRRLLSEASLARLANALVVNEYAAINHVRLTGQLMTYRHFDIILRTMLDHICNSRDQRYHFMQFPLSDRLYTRAQFIRTFRKLAIGTLPILNDPSYFLLIHLLGMVYGQQPDEEAEVPLPPADLALLPEGTTPPLLMSTSLFARVPDAVLARLHLILTHGDSAIIYNLGSLKTMATKVPFFLRVLRHVNMLKLRSSGIELPSANVSDDAFDAAIAEHQATTGEVSQPTVPITPVITDKPVASPAEPIAPPVVVTPEPPVMSTPVVMPPQVTLPPSVVKSPVPSPPAVTPPVITPPVSPVAKPAILVTPSPSAFDYQHHVALALQAHLANTPAVGQLSQNNIDALYQRHLAVPLGDKTIAQHLASVLPDIHTNTLDFLQPHLPEPSMATSSIANLDTLYIEQGMHHDLAKTLTSLVPHGMFVTGIETTPQHSAWTRRTVYKVALTDTTGKRHSLVFVLPHVDATGQMMINGVATRMMKQQINLPICKISPTRVNLSSNYNKTLVERTETRRHNFSSYFTAYLMLLRRAKLVSVTYGKLADSPTKLPYDYSAIGQVYAQIVSDKFVLHFDYPTRFTTMQNPSGGTEAYSEPGTTFSNDGKTYSVSNLFAETEALPTQQFNVADLQWILTDIKFNADDERRITAADLTTPILVYTEPDGRLNVIDGTHRVAKAVRAGIVALPGKLVPSEMLNRHRLYLPIIPVERLIAYEKHYGVFCGVAIDGHGLFMGMDNQIREISPTTDEVKAGLPIVAYLHSWWGDISPPAMVSEWTELKVLDQNFPIIFVLGFRFGLQQLITEQHLAHRWVPSATKTLPTAQEVVISFADGDLVIPRYPLEDSLILAGLLKYPTESYQLAEFDTPDVYYRLLQAVNLSVNYLKGITSFFDFFLDPITIDVLQHMGEPITVRGLLLRASAMLSDYACYDSASMRNHRLRGYERFAGVLYNEMARQLATYQGRHAQKKSFSINPEAVFQRIIQDATMSSVETINPVLEIKANNALTYAGSGGRTAKSFVVEDRRYPDDAVGILSEATPDSSKVAMNTYTSADPQLANLRGMFHDDTTALTPANILSTTAMLFPCSVQDDGKRTNYASTQMNHHVPCLNGEVSRLRTGYEMTIAHRCSEDFSCIAKQDGQVIARDDTLKLLKVAYAPAVIPVSGTYKLPYTELALKQALAHSSPLVVLMTEAELEKFSDHRVISVTPSVNVQLLDVTSFSDITRIEDKSAHRFMSADLTRQIKSHPEMPVAYVRLTPLGKLAPPVIDLFQFGAKYSSVSGAFVQQDLVSRVAVGETFKRGDVLVYNAGFFVPDPDSKQVLWKHGCMANVVLIEMGATLEDSVCVTKALGEQLRMAPAHVRQIELTANTVLRDIVSIGDQVESTDKLCIIEASDLAAIAGTDDPSTLSFLSQLNQTILRAKYHGTIAHIEMYYSCSLDALDPSLAKLARHLAKLQQAYITEARGTLKADDYHTVQHVPPGTRYSGFLFEDDSVMLLITIAESLAAGVGDKLVLASQAKAIIGTVLEKSPASESGVPIDVIFSSSSISRRVINSPYLIGITNRILEKMETEVMTLWDATE